MSRLNLASLCSHLYASGHPALWFMEEYDLGFYEPFLTISSADERELAWWDGDSRSWFLNREANFPCVPDYGCEPSSGELVNPHVIDFYAVIHSC
ncbi:hypothetical protein [Erwinia amylovora]|uniref:hypothetical protein n=1 Tax=Erwinia amylovora TaxID=552 RepID=UPI000AA2AFD5|nr:hypothetical protein [Erwinia amylovora]